MLLNLDRNGETREVYQSHNLREGGRVTCPVLRQHKCELCGATGDSAHTRSYCLAAAVGRSTRVGYPDSFLHFNSAALMNTGRNSSGRERRRRPLN